MPDRQAVLGFALLLVTTSLAGCISDETPSSSTGAAIVQDRTLQVGE